MGLGIERAVFKLETKFNTKRPQIFGLRAKLWMPFLAITIDILNSRKAEPTPFQNSTFEAPGFDSH